VYTAEHLNKGAIMIAYPHLDPEIVRIGPLALRWYGAMYAMGFLASYLLVRFQMKSPVSGPSRDQGTRMLPEGFLDDLYVYLVAGLILGARVGYVLFYDFRLYLADPLEVLAVWHGGMSFHGGLIGSVAAGTWCCRRFRVDPLLVADMVTITAPVGLGLGRIGNFINGELFGRVTDAPWGMVFPNGGPLPRHPSQLYEFLLEGVLLFTILWMLRRHAWPPGVLASVFLLLYGTARFSVEFFREPDPQLGFVVAGMFTMGQVLSSIMIVAGAAGAGFFLYRGRSPRSEER
jgi:phosphatidylglycerol---prolipoprotein diacylglyceryl transferase